MTYKITFKGKTFSCDGSKPILDCALSQKVFMPYSCKAGECQACMVKAISGMVSQDAQTGLSKAQVQQNLFLSCQCIPQSDMVIEPANYTPPYSASILEKTWLNSHVLRLRLQHPDDFQYQAGQYIHIQHPKSKLLRSYSLASLPSDGVLELHIKRFPQGQMSTWLCDEANVGQSIAFSQSLGSCTYQQNAPKQTIILAGVGTGLAPLFGILRDAIAHQHQGSIHLFHASLHADGLYYQQEIQELCEQHHQLSYTPCVLQGDAPQGGKQGSIEQIIVDTLDDFADKRAYVCGDDAVVQRMKDKLVAHGLPASQILADAFVASS